MPHISLPNISKMHGSHPSIARLSHLQISSFIRLGLQLSFQLWDLHVLYRSGKGSFGYGFVCKHGPWMVLCWCCCIWHKPHHILSGAMTRHIYHQKYLKMYLIIHVLDVENCWTSILSCPDSRTSTYFRSVPSEAIGRPVRAPVLLVQLAFHQNTLFQFGLS